MYKNLISDLPKKLDSYKTIIYKIKSEPIIKLKNENEATLEKLEEAQKHITDPKNSLYIQANICFSKFQHLLTIQGQK